MGSGDNGMSHGIAWTVQNPKMELALFPAFFTVLAILGSKDQPHRMRIVQVSTVFKNCNSGYFWRMRKVTVR